MSNYWNIDSGDGNELAAGLSPEIVARRAAQRLANERGESVYLYQPSDDPEEEAESEEVEPMPVDPVVVETMPEQHRDSHRAAGNWGEWPANGAERRIMSREDAEALCDGDEYNHIVRDATLDDAHRYVAA